MAASRTVIPIYTTKGDLGAYLMYPHLFNCQGEWIGWVTKDREVYNVHGYYVGWLSTDPRILRKRGESSYRPRQTPPTVPVRINPPAFAPLAPMMPEIMFDTMDVLDEDPDLLPTLDFGDRPDMD